MKQYEIIVMINNQYEGFSDSDMSEQPFAVYMFISHEIILIRIYILWFNIRLLLLENHV